MWLPTALINDVNETCRVFNLDREAVRCWNNQRSRNEPRAFTGWYWQAGRRQGGPFKTASAAYRDAYYTVVMNMRAPAIISRPRLARRSAHSENRVAAQ